jgi:hypothetical protein
MSLQALQEVDGKETEDTERNHTGRVAYPRLLHVFADSAEPINQGLEPPKYGVKECPLALKDTIHERARGFGDRQHNAKENQYLRSSDPSHFVTSKLLRPKERIHQVNKKSGRHDSRNGVFHGTLLKALGGFRETPEHDKKCNGDSDIKDVQQHNHLTTIAGSKTGRPKTDRALESTKTTR